MELSVVIVSYNVKLLLEQCLHSVEKAITASGKNAEVIVIDNHSQDGTVPYLQSIFSRVKFISNKENEGFSKACNKGIQNATGKYLLFLNPDTIIPDDCFKKCIAFMEAHPDAGAMGVRMINSSGKFLKESKRGFPSPAASFYKLFGLAALFPRSQTFAAYYLGHLPENENNIIDVISGAFMMIPRKVLDQTGFFDESFFMYGEDIDISYRVQQAGFRNYYLADVTIIHLKGKSTPRKDRRYIKAFYDAMNIFVDKHYKGVKTPGFIFFIKTGIRIRRFIAYVIALFS